MKTKWENVQVLIAGAGPNAVSEGLNKMGEEGWEAWQMLERPDSVIVFFKRPKSAILSPEIRNNRGLNHG